MNEEQGSRTTFLVEAATPSFLESPEKKTGRAAIKARAKTKSTVLDFEDITVNGASQEEPDESASDSYMEKGHQESGGGPTTPSFLASPNEPSRRKQRFPSRVAAAAASDFSDITVTRDTSHNKEGMRESAADTSQREQNKEATTPSFLASPEKKAGRTASARAIPQVRVSAFDDVTVSEVRQETPQQAGRTEDDAENSRGCAATPSFLTSPDERSRAKSRFQRRAGVATEADFDDVNMRDGTSQKSPQNGKDKGADASQREQSGKTSFLEAVTPTFLASPALKAGRPGKGARGKTRAATGVADFDDITLGDAAGENRSGGAEETSQREESSVSATLVDVATPSFLASPAEKATRRQVRTKRPGAAVDNMADFTNLDRSLTPKSRETGQDADPAIGSLTPSFLKDSTIQTSVRSARETSARDYDSSAATPRRNRNEKTDTSLAADSAEENRSERAEKVSEVPAGVEEEEGDRGAEKSQKLEETRALRASRKSEVLGYLVR
jgi:hypothetical protein